MHFAFVLLELSLGPIEETLRLLSEIPPIKETHIVFGGYDVITAIEADSNATLKQVALSEIGKLGNVRSTLVLKVVATHSSE